MRRALFIGLLAICAAGGVQAREASPAPPVTEVLEATLVGYVRPGYSRFEDAVAELQASVEALCDAPSQAGLQHVRSRFRGVVARWAGVEWWRIGPVMADNRLERVLFFPDRKGTGRKQVIAALSNRDQSVLSASSLSGKSVAMQGLGALDYVLFGKGSEALTSPDAPHRCGFARAASANLARLAGEIVAGWGEDTRLTDLFVEPGSENPLFRTDREALTILLGQMIHGLEALRDTRLGAFLDGEDPSRDRPRSAPLWRSGTPLLSIAEGLDGLERLFTRSGIEQVVEAGSPKLGDMIRFEFAQAINTARALDELQRPVAQLLQEPETRARLVYLRYAIKTVITRLDTEFAAAAGLTVGFSFGDGD